ncbi:MAG: alkaline phosphatase family protein [Desulfobulbus sp.]|jgi:predicted AlkP superfamily pyrophosphatase or phosphodiesterase
MPKLLFIVIDGLTSDTLACAHVPCLDALARRGVSTTVYPPPGSPQLLLPLLTSLFTSLPPEEHGVLTNSGLEPLTSHPLSLFSLLQYRCRSVSAFFSNDRLVRLFPPGALHTSLLINSQGLRNVDRELTKQAGRHLQQQMPDFCLVHLEGVGIAAACFGRISEPCMESIEQADRMVGILLEDLAVVGLDGEYAIMVMGGPGPARQPGEETREAHRPLFFAAPETADQQAEPAGIALLDLAPTMAALAGLSPHPDWRGRIETRLLPPPPDLDTLTTHRRKTAAPA